MTVEHKKGQGTMEEDRKEGQDMVADGGAQKGRMGPGG